jgi:hypothetical protein
MGIVGDGRFKSYPEGQKRRRDMYLPVGTPVKIIDSVHKSLIGRTGIVVESSLGNVLVQFDSEIPEGWAQSHSRFKNTRGFTRERVSPLNNNTGTDPQCTKLKGAKQCGRM